MNERIKLPHQEWLGYDPIKGDIHGYTPEQINWFADRIVKECIKQGNTLANHYINTHSEQEQVMLLASIADYSNEIRKYFGIEE